MYAGSVLCSASFPLRPLKGPCEIWGNDLCALVLKQESSTVEYLGPNVTAKLGEFMKLVLI